MDKRELKHVSKEDLEKRLEQETKETKETQKDKEDETKKVEEWCYEWLRTKANKESLSYYEQHIRCYIIPVLGKMKICDVKLKDLNKITSKMAKGELSETSRKKGLNKKELAETKKPLKKKTIANVKNTISKIKNDGAEGEEKVILNKEQKSKLLNFLVNDEKEDTKTVSLMLLIQYTRGLRASEVCRFEMGRY